MVHFSIVALLFTLFIGCIDGYKIVFMIHGVMGDSGSLEYLHDYIKQVCNLYFTVQSETQYGNVPNIEF